MKTIEIPRTALISIIIAIVSLGIIIVNTFEIISYNHPLKLESLSEQNMEVGGYVQGMISECITVPVFDRQDKLSGTDGEFFGELGRTYNSYTVPIAGGKFIKVWIYDSESKKAMERIVGGDTLEVSFNGKIQKGGAINQEWYNWNPNFDQSRVVADYVIWQKNIDKEKNLCYAGLLGMVIAALLYYFSGGIQIEEVSQE